MKRIRRFFGYKKSQTLPAKLNSNKLSYSADDVYDIYSEVGIYNSLHGGSRKETSIDSFETDSSQSSTVQYENTYPGVAPKNVYTNFGNLKEQHHGVRSGQQYFKVSENIDHIANRPESSGSHDYIEPSTIIPHYRDDRVYAAPNANADHKYNSLTEAYPEQQLEIVNPRRGHVSEADFHLHEEEEFYADTFDEIGQHNEIHHNHDRPLLTSASDTCMQHNTTHQMDLQQTGLFTIPETSYETSYVNNININKDRLEDDAARWKSRESLPPPPELPLRIKVQPQGELLHSEDNHDGQTLHRLHEHTGHALKPDRLSASSSMTDASKDSGVGSVSRSSCSTVTSGRTSGVSEPLSRSVPAKLDETTQEYSYSQPVPDLTGLSFPRTREWQCNMLPNASFNSTGPQSLGSSKSASSFSAQGFGGARPKTSHGPPPCSSSNAKPMRNSAVSTDSGFPGSASYLGVARSMDDFQSSFSKRIYYFYYLLFIIF